MTSRERFEDWLSKNPEIELHANDSELRLMWLAWEAASKPTEAKTHVDA